MDAREKRAFEEVRNRINEAFDAIGEQSPEAAEYLRQHIEFNELKGTVRYTGDERIKLYGPFNFN